MPEGLDKQIKAIQPEIVKAHRAGVEDFVDIVESGGMEYLGKGSETVVVKRKGQDGDSDVVFALDYSKFKDEKIAKEVYYSHRILATLFPYNFPKFHASWGDSKSANSGQVRENISKKGEGDRSVYSFERVLEVKNELALPFWFDPGRSNYHTGADGGEYYLDWVVKENNKPFDSERIFEWMNKNNYSDQDINTVKKSISRLEVLG